MDDSGQQVGLSENDRGLRLTVTELTTNNPVAAVGTRIEAGAEATTRKRGATTEAQPSEAVIRKRGATIAAQPKVGFCLQACVIEIHYLENRFTADVEIYVNFMPPKNEQNEDRRERDSSRTRFVTLDISDPVLAWKPALGTFYAAHKAEIQVENYVLDSHTGRVFILVNSIVDLHETFELHDFPFDRQILPIAGLVTGCSLGAWGVSKEDTPPTILSKCSFIHEDTSWRLHDTSLSVSVSRGGSTYNLKVRMERHPEYYLWNVCFVMFLVVLCAPINAGVNQHDLADRMSITLTLYLTAVAYKFVIMTIIPQVSYLTQLDKYCLMTFGFLTISLVENFGVSQIMMPDIDVAAEIDKWFCTTFAAAWIVLHLVLAALWRTGRLTTAWEDLGKKQQQGRKTEVTNISFKVKDGGQGEGADSADKGAAELKQD